MELIKRINSGESKLFVDEDMATGQFFRIAQGLASVYSSRCPGANKPNEDAAALIAYGDSQCVIAVADGVGGNRSGNEASKAAIRSLRNVIMKARAENRDLRDAILDGFEAANKAVIDLSLGALTTLAVVEVQGNSVRTYHVGDSLILAIGQRGKLKLQTVCHSPVGYALEAGVIDEEAAMFHEERHIVSNLVGTNDMRIEIGSAFELSAKDTLIITSDGLSDNVRIEEIVESVKQSPLPQTANELSKLCATRMNNTKSDTPSKPDDLTFIMFRLRTGLRKDIELLVATPQNGNQKPNGNAK
jgi:serine/threonine protein phosphatase PrpC